MLSTIMDRRQGIETISKPKRKHTSSGKHWTPEEDKIMAGMAGNFTSTEIGKRLGRSKKAVSFRAHALGISLETRKGLVKLDGKAKYRICGMYMDGMTSPNIAKEMTRITGIEITEYKVRSVIFHAGINNRRHNYTHDENIFIARNWVFSQADTIKFLGLGITAVRNQHSRLERKSGCLKKLRADKYTINFQRKVNKAGMI